MEKYTYLLINFLTIFFPIILSFDKKVYFFQYWKKLFIALGIAGLLFIGWDIIFTIFNVWSFNEKYIVLGSIFQLPIEEMMFFITVPFACFFIQKCLEAYFKLPANKGFEQQFQFFMFGFSIAMLFFYYEQLYTLITFSLMFLLIGYNLFIGGYPISKFLWGYLISLVPFFIVNGILTNLPVVMYNDSENIGVRILGIPFEDAFYLFDLNFLIFLIFSRIR